MIKRRKACRSTEDLSTFLVGSWWKELSTAPITFDLVPVALSGGKTKFTGLESWKLRLRLLCCLGNEAPGASFQPQGPVHPGCHSTNNTFKSISFFSRCKRGRAKSWCFYEALSRDVPSRRALGGADGCAKKDHPNIVTFVVALARMNRG